MADASCRNWLCQGKAGPIYISQITALAFHTGPLREKIDRFKNQGKTGWEAVFAKLLLGHLEANWNPGELNLIVANPPSPGRDHTTRVVDTADKYDAWGSWPFATSGQPILTKRYDTQRSANSTFQTKNAAAQAHADALTVDEQLNGRVLVYDDVCTTGLQLNQVARVLLEAGATEVVAVVLARQPWN